MDDPIRLPELTEIRSWQVEQCRLERTRLRNELAFISGDRAHGGPPREALYAALRSRLDAVERRISAALDF